MVEKSIIINLKKGGYSDKTILKEIESSIEKGKFTAIAGPNGSGKTTLLRYLIKELKTENNSVFIDNKDINRYSREELARKISFLGQYSTLDQDFSVRETVSFGRYCHKDMKSAGILVDKAIDTVGIRTIADYPVTRISGGEFQLVMLARVLCQDSDIILLDEPSNNLDPKHMLLLMDILKKETEKGKTVIAVLHDLNSILNYADNTILLKNGTIFAQGLTKKMINPENIQSVFEVNCEINLCHDRRLSAFCYSL